MMRQTFRLAAAKFMDPDVIGMALPLLRAFVRPDLVSITNEPNVAI
jgi:hypothetical protein